MNACSVREDVSQAVPPNAPVRNVMRFHLVYSGPLSAAGNKGKAAEAALIRGKLSRQLEHLWDTHHALQVLRSDAAIPPPNAGLTVAMVNGRRMTPREMAKDGQFGFTDLIPPYRVADKAFMPLVRKSLHLNCEIDILFLRQQDPGELISQGGDIDNRVKTLLDALRQPDTDVEQKHPTPTTGADDRLVFCLLESDTLVSRLNIDTDRRLFPETDKPNEVHLVIEIGLNVLRVSPYNLCLL